MRFPADDDNWYSSDEESEPKKKPADSSKAMISDILKTISKDASLPSQHPPMEQPSTSQAQSVVLDRVLSVIRANSSPASQQTAPG